MQVCISLQTDNNNNNELRTTDVDTAGMAFSDSVVYVVELVLFCEGGGGVRFIPA